jgi:NAD(P)-dependent dehydrogenase (short-subunit alcohol dehydrogenase family)
MKAVLTSTSTGSSSRPEESTSSSTRPGPRISEYGNGKPAVDLPVAEFLAAQTVLTSQFITARGAAQRMIPQGSGVIIFLTGSRARPHLPGSSGIGAAFGGIENLTRTMALELSGTGVRVVCLRTAANPDTRARSR